MRRSLPMVALLLAGCLSEAPEGIAPAEPADTTVKLDFAHRPLPDLPLPNDLATRFDASSATGRRLNASMIAPTQMERRVRTLLDTQDGWGVFAPITIPFTGPLDVGSILAGHRDPDFAFGNDVVYLVNVTPDSSEFGQLTALDIGNGSFPMALENRDAYWGNDPRAGNMTLYLEEVEEDLDGDGVMDPGEDTDLDGVLDHPNYFPGATPAADDVAARVDATMTFYERETNTLIVRPMEPLLERTTYAVIVTRRLKDAGGAAVGSPYPFVNHAAQTEALTPLLDVLPAGLEAKDIGFTFSFTTQTVGSAWVAVRDGLYGHGVQAHLGGEFPPDLDRLAPLVDPTIVGSASQLHILRGEDFKPVFRSLATQLLGLDGDSEEGRVLLEGLDYVDYIVMGTYRSPQLFPRVDADGRPLNYNLQSWPQDLDRKAAPTRSEEVWFTLVVPRKEVSARGEGKPAPTVILGHGYGSSRFEAISFAGHFARQGLATISIDCVSHGLGVGDDERELAEIVLGGYGLGPFVDALFSDRALDQNGDGRVDSGADFWTGYLFHTRDVVRQSALDYLQLVRILRAFDGQKRFGFDTGGDGVKDLAGDFDGDGNLDVGGDAILGMTGGSLGGIMAAVVGAIEPELDAIAPISAGGGLGDTGARTTLGGVRAAVVLRVMGPLFIGDTVDGALQVQTIVPDLNDDARFPIGALAGVQPGQILVVENGANGERGCGRVQADGRVRAAVATDLNDPIRLALYAEEALVSGDGCVIEAGATPVATLETFESEVLFQAQTFPVGAPLVSLQEGLGLERGTPDLRRFLGLGQLVLDGADPAVFAKHLQRAPLKFPGKGDQTGVHALIVTSVGDMVVPAAGGASIGRAAGFIDYRTIDPRWGKTQHQVLADTFTLEGVHNLGRFRDPAGNGVHMDIEDFGQGEDLWTGLIPRLDPPFRAYGPDSLGGVSGSIFPYPTPEGQHGFAFPGAQIDTLRERCRASCPEGQDCGCATATTFDVGSFMFGMMGEWIGSGGVTLNDDLCHSRRDCPGQAPPPAPRD